MASHLAYLSNRGFRKLEIVLLIKIMQIENWHNRIESRHAMIQPTVTTAMFYINQSRAEFIKTT